MPPVEPILTVQNLRKIYPGTGGNGIHAASFSLERGTFFTLLGPSGCGKTTTLRCIAGLEQPDRGIIKVGERVMFDSAARIDVPLNRRQFGMVFQSYAIWPHMTVFENVAFPLRVAKDRRFARREIAQMVEHALETVSLGGFADRSATRLSGGQQQRVALARAIVRHPQLLLLDEPLSNLDAKLREEMRNELRRLQQQIGITTVYVTHDQSEALELSDRIAVMRAGDVIQIGTPREIYFDPHDAFVAGFVGSANWLQGLVQSAPAEGLATVRLPSGSEIRCVLRDSVAEGQPARVSVRPESVSLVPPEGRPRADVNRLPGTVVLAGFVGSITRVQVDVEGVLIQAFESATVARSVGERVAIEFPCRSALAFGQ
jgi:iron(III) transport system ATP-binding protein